MRTSLSCDLRLQVEPVGSHEGGGGVTTEHSVLPPSSGGGLYEIQLEDVEVLVDIK